MPEAHPRIGILGSGQLARMLFQAAEKDLGLKPIVFASVAEDSACLAGAPYLLGNLNDRASLQNFFDKIDLLCFESDFLPFQILRELIPERLLLRPSLDVFELTADKLKQKKLFQKLGLPSPEAVEFSGDLESWKASVSNQLQNEIVFKWAKGGYDGKGVWVVDREPSEADGFLKAAIQKKVPLFAERKMSYRRELALVSSYSTTGEFAFLPLVVTEQKKGICDRVYGPASQFAVDASLEIEAQKMAEAIGRELKLYGSFAVEFFEDQTGRLWINEIAPRVHNSGHFSIDASVTSQFTNHWLGVLGKKLGSTASLASAFAMQNLIAPAKLQAVPPLRAISPPLFFNDYQKGEGRPGRKMAHLNALIQNPSDADSIFTQLKSLEKLWLKAFESSHSEPKENH